ncbi:MAG: glutamine--fructose-6-phosphate transaminase (isomerizing) [Eubacteriaceae bacterium]|nr:glutamine--fructose-6-phosphate transaminase (isomerizing) [Eubacteriaceae bacterium]
MCGIVGYIGNQPAQKILINGLSKLEYRGYDSAGIAVYNEGKINIEKKKGRLQNLENRLNDHALSGVVGIGHTRWATHGEPSDTNVHPHASIDGNIAVVHNGIIENYMALKESLIAKGHMFRSDTDTEVVAHLIDMYYEGDIVAAVIKAVKALKGSYSLGILCAKEPEKLIAVRKDSPLIVGIGDNENFIASDIPAILSYTRDVYLLDNDEIAILENNHVTVLDRYGEKVGKQVFKVDWDPGDAEKGGYDHFMLKEINEQPKALRDVLSGRCFHDHVSLDQIHLTKNDLDKISRIQIIACGTAYHAALVGRYLIEKYARITVETETAAEYRYCDPIVDEKTMMIVISQSGETADTLAALRLAKTQGARVVAITNVVGSSIAREADDVLYTNAGPEIAVASTKAYVTQVACMMLFAMELGRLNGHLSDEKITELSEALSSTPELVEEALKQQKALKQLAIDHFKVNDAYFIGRGLDYYTCMEGSLKMKEVSYIHSEAYPAGELKHGAIALIEEGSLVIALCTQENVFDKMLSNIKEVKARGAFVLAIAQSHHPEISSEVDQVFFLPDGEETLSAINAVVYLQIFAYYLAVARGCDVDKPKNLAKSVTVE